MELKELAGYLPYGLRIEIKPILIDIQNFSESETMELLRCLVVDWEIIANFNGDYLSLPYKNIEKAFENHIDIFGLIPRGLAINKSELEK